MKKNIYNTIATLLLIFFHSIHLFAQWSHNTAMPIAAYKTVQENNCMVSDGGGGVFVAWTDNRTGYYNIYLQHLTAAGTPLLGNFDTGLKISDNNSNAEIPDLNIIADLSGGVIIAWSINLIATNLTKTGFTYSQKVSSSGTTMWTNGGVSLHNTTNGTTSGSTQLISDGSGGAIVGWHHEQTGNKGNSIQRILTGGGVLWNANGIHIYNDDALFKLVSDGGTGVIIVNCNIGGIYAQKVNASGVKQWGLANGVNPINFVTPNLKFDIVASSAGVIIVYQDDLGTGGGNDLFIARLNSSGALTFGGGNGLLLCSTNLSKCNSLGIRADGSGGAIVVWDDSRISATGKKVYSQKINSTGSFIWTTNGINISGTDTCEYPSPKIAQSDFSSVASISWQNYLTDNFNSNYNYKYLCKRIAIASPYAGYAGQLIGTDWTNGIISSDVSDGVFLLGKFANQTLIQKINFGIQWESNGIPINDIDFATASPAIAGNLQKGSLMAWESLSSIDTFEIYVEKMDSMGNHVWDSLNNFSGNTTNQDANYLTRGKPVSLSNSKQRQPSIVSDGLGGAIIVWQDTKNGNSEIYAQRLNENGNRQWPAGLFSAKNGVLICTATGYKFNPQIVADATGGFIIVWEDWRSLPNSHLYAQKIDINGYIQWAAAGVPICTASVTNYSSEIIALKTGGAIIAWADDRSGINDIYAQRIASGGTVQWVANGKLVCNAIGEKLEPSLVLCKQNGCIVSWTDHRSGTAAIYAQRININGTNQWSNNGVLICNSSSAQTKSISVQSDSSSAIIAWLQPVNQKYHYLTQKIDSSGLVKWNSSGISICANNSNMNYLKMIKDSAQGAIFVWMDDRLYNNHDIFVQHIDEAGVIQWLSLGKKVNNNLRNQQYPAIIENTRGGAIIAWKDDCNYNINDVYAQRINSKGHLGNTSVIDVSSNNIHINNNDFSPSVDDFTDYGIQEILTNKTHVFRITNKDFPPITINYVTMFDDDFSSFNYTFSTPTTLMVDQFIDLSITFNSPTVGLKKATINIGNSGLMDNPYKFTIQGTGKMSAIINTIAGSSITGNTGNGGLAIFATLNKPSAIVTDTAKNIYIADSVYHVIRRIDSNGVITLFAGTGIGGYNGENISRLSANLNLPSGLFFHKQNGGELFIAEAGNHRIRKINLVSGLITTIVGTGVAGYNGDGAIGTSTQINTPMGMCSNGTSLYFADNENNRVRRIHLTTNIVNTSAGNGTAGFSGDGGSASLAQLNDPTDVCINSTGTILYIADKNNARIRRILFGGIFTYIGTGTHGYNGNGQFIASAQLDHPRGVELDSNDVLYVLDDDNERIRKVGNNGFSGEVLYNYAGNGNNGFSGDGGLATSAKINSVADFCFNSNNDMYIADKGNHRIRVVGDILAPAFHSKQILQGYYMGYSGVMEDVLVNQLEGTNTNLCDTITVELHNSIAPYNVIASEKTIIDRFGNAPCNFAHLHGTFYLVIKHRNSIATWSANPITLSGNPFTYNFDSPSKAYGNNLAPLPIGYYGIYSGDLNQDENIDLLDLSILETDINDFQFGYFATDINGDGNVDLLDAPITEDNINNFIFSIHP